VVAADVGFEALSMPSPEVAVMVVSGPRGPTQQTGWRKPNTPDDLGVLPRPLTCALRGDGLSEPRLQLLAMVEQQHAQLQADLERHRIALIECISGLAMLPQVSADSVYSSSQPEARPTAQSDTPQCSPVLSDPQTLDRSNLEDRSYRLPEPICKHAELGEVYESGTQGIVVDKASPISSAKFPRLAMFNPFALWKCLAETLSEQISDVAVSSFEIKFDMVIVCIIILNVITIMLNSQWEGYRAAVVLGRTADGEWEGAEDWFDTLEHVFTSVFLLEFLFRLRLNRLQYFTSIANVFDAFLIFTSVLEVWILTPFANGAGINVTGIRIIRMCRIIRVLRIIRIMKFCKSLHIMISAIISSFSSLFWTMIVLLMMILLAGLFMCQVLSEFIKDENNALETRDWVFKYYGGSARAAMTMFEVTMSGCWPNYSRKLIEEVSVWFALFFLFYISAVVFAVTRVISAIFLKDTLDAASQESDLVALELKSKREAWVRKLSDFFKAADLSGDGMIDREEFEEVMKNPDVRTWFDGLDLHVNECSALFNLLDRGNGHISFDEFLEGVQRLKGNARAVDMVSVAFDVRRLKQKLENVETILRNSAIVANYVKLDES